MTQKTTLKEIIPIMTQNTKLTVDGANVLLASDFTHGFLQFGERVPIYDAEQMHTEFSWWLAHKTPEFARMYRALNTTYKPLDNYNMTETVGETTNGTTTNNRTTTNATTTAGNENSINSGTFSETTRGESATNAANSNNSATDISAFDSADYSPESRQLSATATTDTTTGNSAVDRANAQTIGTERTGATTADTSDSNTEISTGGRNTTTTRSGNIGVTTSQQMLESEIALRAKNDLLSYICAIFVNQYCIW